MANMKLTTTVNAMPFALDKIMNTPRMTEAWARSSRTADGCYSSTIPMSVYAHSCYEEGCKLERELAATHAEVEELKQQHDKLIYAVENLIKAQGRYNTQIAYTRLADTLKLINNTQ